MKVLVVGSGGREHALVWKLKQSPLCTEIICAPGNAGISKLATLAPIGVDAINELADFAKRESVGLVVVGPEIPLADGLADIIRKKGIPVFGPSKEAAQLEGSKIFARNLMQKYTIPTPEFQSFSDPAEAKQFIRELDSRGKQSVVKADGLAAGKGAIVTSSVQEAEQAVDLCIVEKAFGDAGATVVIEERLSGPELSILVITDGKKIVVLPPSQDHKPVGEGDTGLNTGGMGAYSPVPMVTDALLEKIHDSVLRPTIQGMEKEGIRYTGVLYAGLMISDDGVPYVIEFNCRFGDPETEAVLPAIEEDLLPLLLDSANGTIREDRVIQASKNSLCVIMASGGYPGSYAKGKIIHGLDDVEESMHGKAIIFHAGTSAVGEDIVTAGGRVLGITGLGSTFDEAFDNAYAAVDKLAFDEGFCRRDIGYRVRSS